MPTRTAQSILNSVSEALLDTGAVRRWNQETVLRPFLNDGQREAARLRPELTATVVDVALVAGVNQSVPSTGQVLIDVVRNMGVGGGVSGPSITLINEDDLSSYNPNWPSTAGSVVVEHYMIDARNPNKFKVYPPQPVVPGNVELVYSSVPADIVGLGALGVLNGTEVITLDDQYANPLRDYALYRALSSEGTEQDLTKAAASYKLFQAGIGVEV